MTTQNPELLKMPLARDGDKTAIPETSGATTGDFSQQYGFQQINSLPLGAGGKAPKRNDFNGIFNLLSNINFYAQKGWTFHYDSTQDYYLGCVVIDPADGNRYECIADMTAGTVAPHEDTDGDYWRRFTLGDGEAVGVIKQFAGNGDIPSGYLLCDGSAVSRAMFPDLFSAIGTTYGSGDGSTTFNLPDYNTAARFAQGGTVAGVEKEAGLPNITGIFDIRRWDASGKAVIYTEGALVDKGNIGSSNNNIASLTSLNPTQRIGIDASRSSSIYGNSDTVQPNSLTTRYIIKAFDGMTPDSALIDITQYAEAVADARVPIGMMLPCATETARKNFLLCDGSAVSRDTYSALFAVIGTKYGAGDGSTTFNLPDYNVSGRFVQGGTTAGTVHNAGLPNITGETVTSVAGSVAGSAGWIGAIYQIRSAGWIMYGGSQNAVGGLKFDASKSNAIYGASTTVQPPALTACWQIKYC